VLFVEPCSLGHVPVMSVYQPTPVLGGNAGSNPLSPVTPFCMSCLYVGMAPWPAYFCIRSGRIPSDEKNRTLSDGAGGANGRTCADAVPSIA
jgi:hypothetical protein